MSRGYREDARLLWCRAGTKLSALAVFAVEEIADGGAAGSIGFAVIRKTGSGLGGGIVFGFAASGTAVGEAGLVWLQFEFFAAEGTGADRKRHRTSMIKPGIGREQRGCEGTASEGLGA